VVRDFTTAGAVSGGGACIAKPRSVAAQAAHAHARLLARARTHACEVLISDLRKKKKKKKKH
jgi:hypothetical protein